MKIMKIMAATMIMRAGMTNMIPMTATAVEVVRTAVVIIMILPAAIMIIPKTIPMMIPIMILKIIMWKKTVVIGSKMH